MDFQTFNYDRSKIKFYLESVNPINEKIHYLRWLLNEIRFDINIFKQFSTTFRSNLKKTEEEVEISLDNEKFKLHGVHRALGETILGKTKLFEIPDLIINKMLPYERFFLQTSVTEFIDRVYDKGNPYSNFVRNRLFKFLEEYWNEGKNGKQKALYRNIISIMIHDWNEEISCDDDIKIKSSFPVFSFDLFRRFQNREQLSPAELIVLKQFVLDSLICFMNNLISDLEQTNTYIDNLIQFNENKNALSTFLRIDDDRIQFGQNPTEKTKNEIKQYFFNNNPDDSNNKLIRFYNTIIDVLKEEIDTHNSVGFSNLADHIKEMYTSKLFIEGFFRDNGLDNSIKAESVPSTSIPGNYSYDDYKSLFADLDKELTPVLPTNGDELLFESFGRNLLDWDNSCFVRFLGWINGNGERLNTRYMGDKYILYPNQIGLFTKSKAIQLGRDFNKSDKPKQFELITDPDFVNRLTNRVLKMRKGHDSDISDIEKQLESMKAQKSEPIQPAQIKSEFDNRNDSETTGFIEWEKPLYMLAADARSRADEEHIDYIKYYSIYADKYLFRGKKITPMQLKNAYDQARNQGKVD